MNFSRLFMLLVLSGSVATIAFDIWGQVISPGILGWSALAPVPLAQRTIEVVLGFKSKPFAHFMHLFLVGLIAYPFGWRFIFRPIQQRLIPAMPWLLASAIYGVGLFVVAIGILAGPLIAGNPWFLGWTNITWVALIGHTLYGIVCVWIMRYLENRGLS